MTAAMGRAVRRFGVGVWAGLALAAVAAAAPAAAAPAPDGPGALSHFDLARKDCLGTARNRTSRVWFTVADGVLSDTYYPTVDNTNVETLQLVVTDGSTFTDLQTRDTTFTVRALDDAGMACQVTSTARSGRYRIVTRYVTDPQRATVLMKTTFVPLVGALDDYRVYARLDATVNGNGGGGSGNGGADSATIDRSRGEPIPVSSDTVTATNAANRDYAQPVFAALAASRPFLEVSSGFAGAASDGLAQLDASHALTTTYGAAASGNVVQTARLDLAAGPTVTLALGFGADQAGAVGTAAASLETTFGGTLARYEAEWRQYDNGLRPSHAGELGLDPADVEAVRLAYLRSANVLKASEDKAFPGAIVASLASPWGQAVSAGDPNQTYFGSYREVFARDLYNTFTGLLLDGDEATAKATVRFLFRRQQLPDGSMPRNSLVNGKVAPDSGGIQLDEAAYPILMAWQAGMTGPALYENVRRAANFVAAHGPAFGVERWEEQDGFSPSTIAAEVAGLLAAAAMADENGDARSAQLWRGIADDWQRSVKGWTVTTSGPLLAEPYFIRLSKTGDPNAAISYGLGNGGATVDQRSVVDAGFLELVRLGLLAPDDADVLRSLGVVDATIRAETATGPGWFRYNGDGYGDRSSDGKPWPNGNAGNGHLWPVLAGERAEHALLADNLDLARQLLVTMQRQGHGVGLIPEQVWELPDLAASAFGTPPDVASIGFVNGQAAGSADPLTWSAAGFVRLVGDMAAGHVVERPSLTVRPYVRATQGTTPLTVTAPADESPVEESSVVVSGTSAAGNRIVVAGTNVDADSATTLDRVRAAEDGSWSVTVPLQGGTTVLNVVAEAADGGTAHARRVVVFDVVSGTLVLDVADPVGDDHGPGHYAYPTSSDFHAGAFDVERFQVYDGGDHVTFRLRLVNLAPTFGNPLGAQLVDLYLHDPAATSTSTSTAAAFPQRQYAIATDFAWSRLVEVQGFAAPKVVDAAGASAGSATAGGNAVSRYITISVPKADLGGSFGAGWGVTVTLHGQDGFSPDQARSFAPTPQPFQFGVCPEGDTAAACAADPTTVPKVVDLVSGTAGAQESQLDYTAGPVVLSGVTVPAG